MSDESLDRGGTLESPATELGTYDVSHFFGLDINARDGDIGRVDDLYFDDATWTIRYLVVSTGNWLTGRKVLISPHAVAAVLIGEGHILVDLTRQQVEESPDFDNEKPVSRQFETQFYAYYGYPEYWRGPYLSSVGGVPDDDSSPGEALNDEAYGARDTHLQSMRDVIGYHVHAADSAMGHIETALLDEQTWSITAIVIGTRNWWPGKSIMLEPSAVQRVDWIARTVHVAHTRDEIAALPQYDRDAAETAL